MLKAYGDRRIQEIREELGEYESADVPATTVLTPDVTEMLEIEAPEGKWLLQQFKNPKVFFEGGGSKKLKDVLESRILEAVSLYGDRHVERFVPHYEDAYTTWVVTTNEQLRESVDEYVQGGLSAFEEEVDLEDLRSRLDKLAHLKQEPSQP
jgi:hypothetical protein